MFCTNCGKELADNALMCPACGAPTRKGPEIPADASDKDWLTTLLLCFFLGGFGIHSFYSGKPVIGVVQLLTLGGCGIWALIDFIMIICGSFRDGEGKVIVNKR
ncbi:NINE protein [Alistipes sp.]|uniref:TM2 domain-containing protein n=1 Tax=Alistipes sp. TaxID=1872444 RepID=UPI003AEFED1A